MKNRNFFIAVIILISASIITLLSYLPSKYVSGEEAKMSDFPRKIGEWEGKDLTISERDYEILETRNLIMREYVNSSTGDTVYLYIVYSGDNRKVVHPPEICYTGGGATIIEKSVIPITSSIKANKFITEDKESRQLVVYWFKTLNLHTYDYLKQQIRIAVNRMFRKRTSGALIRLSTVIKSKSEEAALGLIKDFCRQIEKDLNTYVP